MNIRYGAWLRDEAETHGQPWVETQPWETLAERIIAVASRR